jgi:hypothetical protein
MGVHGLHRVHRIIDSHEKAPGVEGTGGRERIGDIE